MQFRMDLICIENRRSGVSSDRLSHSSGLRDQDSLAELDKIIDSLVAGEACRFDDSMESHDAVVASHGVARANAAMSQDLLGNVSVGSLILLEFRRDPDPFHAALLEGPELAECRQLLEEHKPVQLACGAKVFVKPDMYEFASEIATSRGLQLRHVLVEPEFETFVMAAMTSLRSKLQVRLKSKDDNVWVFAAKKFPSGYPTASSWEDIEEEEGEEISWQVTRTFIEFPVPSSLCSNNGQKLAKSV